MDVEELEPSGHHDLVFGAGLQRLGKLLWGLLVIPFALLLAPLPNYTWGAAFAFAGFLGVLNLGQTFELRTRAWFDDERLGMQSVWCGRREFEWSEITDVAFSFAFGRLVVRGPNGTKLRVSQWMEGNECLAAALWFRHPNERTRRAIYRWYKARQVG